MAKTVLILALLLGVTGCSLLFSGSDPASQDSWQQSTYLKAPTPSSGDLFGTSVSLSGDGNTMAIGSPQGPQEPSRGAVDVYARVGATWEHQAHFLSEKAGSLFGFAVSLSGNGNTLAIGAFLAGKQQVGEGSVFLYEREDGNWSAPVTLRSSEPMQDAHFGRSVSLSAAGNTLAIGETSASVVYLFHKDVDAWTLQQRLVGTPLSGFGYSVSLGDTDTMLAIGAPWESHDSVGGAGAVYLVEVGADTPIKLQASPGTDDRFGWSVSLSGNGAWLVVGAPENGNTAAPNTGSAYVYTLVGNTWTSHGRVKPAPGDAGDAFGVQVAVDYSGDQFAVGAFAESSSAMGVNGMQDDNSQTNSGAAYVFVRKGQIWSQDTYVKASNTSTEDQFGFSLTIDSEGDTLLIGTPSEDSASTDDMNDNSASNAGAAYLFERGQD